MTDGNTRRNIFSKIFDTDNEVYSFRMATVFCLVLSALLWWIPVLGPAVAGYVCGRKAGSMTKGLVCAFVSGVLLSLIVWGLSYFVMGSGGFPDVPADIAATSFTGIVGAVASYLQTFFVEGTSSLDLMNIGVVTVFGGVGGILSKQILKETAYLLAKGAAEGKVRSEVRSIDLYRKNKTLGFESFSDCIASANDPSAKGNKKAGITDNENKTKGTVAATVQTVNSQSPSETPAKTSENPFAGILSKTEKEK